jgi:hypothetical protein
MLPLFTIILGHNYSYETIFALIVFEFFVERFYLFRNQLLSRFNRIPTDKLELLYALTFYDFIFRIINRVFALLTIYHKKFVFMV